MNIKNLVIIFGALIWLSGLMQYWGMKPFYIIPLFAALLVYNVISEKIDALKN